MTQYVVTNVDVCAGPFETKDEAERYKEQRGWTQSFNQVSELIGTELPAPSTTFAIGDYVWFRWGSTPYDGVVTGVDENVYTVAPVGLHERFWVSWAGSKGVPVRLTSWELHRGLTPSWAFRR